ncbi:MAG TPA: flagellar biosynthesis protein FlhF [Noviherbaspirillum sp.]|jgi:flagellar biosynthesis protein FlhF|uniref:flagellar biosynthesis protein FlhF n=1 Tax=Noviherbaspirillum sp. TaxID=1926288 RepID=UPI002DDD1C2E|nr:flagellar biosynthesis protein FlhF [Noviherbaspirillum sp.]HEV2609559.1 flagellar biosynthesis protein FlhF [Noviherbaspirillum sp.]
MNVKKFSASTSRDAWRQVREALGPDAVILSNRTINGMVEILALASEDMSSLAEPAVEKQTLSKSTLASLAPKPRPESDQAAGLAEALAAARTPPQAQETAPATASAELAQVMSEIRSMRGMLESQLTEIAWGSQQKREPAKGLVMREMLAAGFSASLARYLVEKLPAGEKPEGAMNWIKSVLTRNLAVVDNEAEIMGKGGVFALVGPTGVGKTTTTAKLAARCVMRHGAGKLALITTDGYRIGGYEQLRIYGKILGVMVHSVKDETDLRIALDEMKNKHTVLIDTVGMGQRDKMVAEQIAMLSGAGTKVKRLLCLSATSSGETLNEVVRSYQGSGLAGCIMTKLDEAATIGSLLDVAIRQKLSLYYVANGQRVPEDLHVANQHYLVDRAFKLKRETAPFLFQESELPLVMANTARSMNDKELREVRIG